MIAWISPSGFSGWDPMLAIFTSQDFSIPDLPSKDTATMAFVDMSQGAYKQLVARLVAGSSDSFIHTYSATQGQCTSLHRHSRTVNHLKLC